MAESSSLFSLMLVVSVAFFVPIVLHRLKLKMIPVVVAEIVVGLVLGTSGLNIIKPDQWLELLSMFGFIYLMFSSGLEVDFTLFGKKRGSRRGRIGNPFTVAVLCFLGILALSFALARFLVWTGIVSDVFLMTIIIATISLGVVVPVLKERKLINTELGQVILLTSVISDLVTMILLAVYISLKSNNNQDLWLLMLFFAVIFVLFYLIRFFVKGKIFEVLRASSIQLGTRAVFTLILLFVVLSQTLQVEMILGAFMAGVVVSLLITDKTLIHQLDSFGYGFLVPIFFVMVGVELDLWSLFTDAKLLLFIPLLLAAICLSKFVPALVLRRWYGWRHTIGSGFLLSSTLSLVIAAAAVAHQAGMIDASMHSALILVAVLSCLIYPVLFNRFFPEEESRPRLVGIVGANHMTLPVSQDLVKSGFRVNLYSVQPPEEASKEERYSRYPLVQVRALTVDELERKGFFDSDIVVLGTMDDDVNIELARAAKERDIERIIVRVEHPEKHDRLQHEGGFAVLSTLYASRTLLKGLVEHPGALEMITAHDDTIREIVVGNPDYDHVSLRELPYLGEVLILRIFRGDTFVIPHGDTVIQLGDRLLVSGDANAMYAMKQELG